jgi:hypothetical protein
VPASLNKRSEVQEFLGMCVEQAPRAIRESSSRTCLGDPAVLVLPLRDVEALRVAVFALAADFQ